MRSQEQIVAGILDRLSSQSSQIKDSWNNPQGTATRHFVVDDLLPPELAEQIYNAFPKDAQGFHSRKSFREKKRTSADIHSYDPILADITFALQSAAVIERVGELTGMQNLEPDPRLYAGGLSMMFRGDYLNPHIDNSHDADRTRYRRLNLLYYVAPDWREENGGNLELWDADVTRQQTITSRFNRLAVMETHKTSTHSVSPVTAESPRCCVSNYYFSAQSPDGSEYFHVTSFTGRPGQIAKRAIAPIDNGARGFVAKILGTGSGKDQMNQFPSETIDKA